VTDRAAALLKSSEIVERHKLRSSYTTIRCHRKKEKLLVLDEPGERGLRDK